MRGGIILVPACMAAGLLATLVLAAWLTPRAWWRRANVRALTVLATGTLAIGGALAWLAWPAPAAQAALPPAILLAGHSYRVYQDLNLRAASGVDSPRLAVVPAGASVTATGKRDGDWWQVSAQLEGRVVCGWASSLWLRRPGETAR
jgi:hypothetical protein